MSTTLPSRSSPSPARAEDTDGSDMVGLLKVRLLPPENTDDSCALSVGLAGDAIHPDRDMRCSL
ncbi:MAG: hypothetical protein GX625_19325 [Clostridiaceae bacterium]|nr:hypothetical protein [Clostridiaceae bacterium]